LREWSRVREVIRVYTFNIRLADVTAEVHVIYESTRHFCRDYLTDTPAEISVTVTHEDIANERVRSAAEHELEGIPTPDFSDAYLETLALYRRLTRELLRYDVLLVHGSAIMMEGRAYLFTARSGTGKSTHTRLWRETFGERCTMVNDDKPLLRITDSGVTVYGTPWNGKHRLGENISAPLAAISVLTRSRENSITPLTVSEALPHIFTQVNRPDDPDALRRTMLLTDTLMHSVGLYRLGCNMSEEAALVAYSGMNENK
jgi:hypothetical protein